MNGKKLSLYIPTNTVKFYEDLMAQSGLSKSKTIANAIYDANVQARTGVTISDSAYLCLAKGRFDLLTSLRLDNGKTIISMREEAYKLPDGSRGVFADEKDKLMKYLSEKQ